MLTDSVFYEFGDFVLDVEGRRLLRVGDPVSMGHKALPVLASLIRNRSRIVPLDELLLEHWGPDAFDRNLVEQTILRIRRKLGDDVDFPRYIRTVDTVGYKFIADVREHKENPLSTRSLNVPSALETVPPVVSDQPSEREEVRPDTGESTDRTRGYRNKSSLFLVIPALASLALLAFWYRPALPEPHVKQIVPITQNNQIKLAPILTDGPRVYFQEQVNTGYRVAEAPNLGGDVTPLRIPILNPELCDLSPDHTTLLLRSLIHSRLDLNPVYLLKLSNGEPQRLSDMEVFEINWLRDGRSVIYSVGSDVFTYALNSGTRRQMFNVRGRPYWFRVSPDGRRVRFSVIEPGTDALHIWETGLDGGMPHRVWPDWTQQQCCGGWTEDGKYFLFQAVVEGKYQVFSQREGLALFRKIGAQPVQLTFGPMSYRAPRPSLDGRRIFVRATLSRGDLQVYDRQDARFVPLLPNVYANFATIANDRKSLAFVTSPDYILWRAAGDGTSEQRLTDGPLQAALPRWSPDGTQLAFMGRFPNSQWKIYLVSSSGGAPQLLLPTDDENEADPDWSPDGQQLTFGRLPARLQSSPAKILIHLVDLKEQRILTLPNSQGYFSPRWSPNGREIAAVSQDGQTVAIYDVRKRAWSTAASSRDNSLDWKKGAGYLNWSADGQYLYFSVAGRQGRSILRLRRRDNHLDLVVRLDSIRQPSFLFGDWVGLTPNNAPIVVQDRSVEDIFALEWITPR
jgi:Tol biopolymer transport system component/DNA-binding winged helix-turn-helix (wHTH) protein